MKRLKDYSEDVYKCTRCGLCQSVCPVYEATGLEPAVSRGKFTLLNGVINGKVKLTKKVAKYLEMCLGCKACFDFCPSGISAEEIVTAARHENSRINGISLIKKFIIANFNSNFRLRLLKFVLAFYKNSGFIKITEFFAKYSGDPGKVIKLFNSQLTENIKYKKLNPAKGKVSLKVVFFPGCIGDYVNRSTKNAVLMVLEKNGYDVQIPEGFSCCGIAAKTSGDYESFEKLAKNNLDLIPDDVDYVITDCASCGSVWEMYPGHLEGKLKEKAVNIARKAVNINKFLMEQDFYIPEGVELNDSVTFHDPCHLKRFQNVSNEPREVLSKIPGIEFVEMDEPDKCCGAAGTFCVSQPEISRAISVRKAKNISKTKADIASTSCSGCKIGIAQGLIEINSLKPILTPVELLAKLYLKEPKKS